MFNMTRKGLAWLLKGVSAPLWGAASRVRAPRSAPFQGLTTALALDDTAPLRLALGEWLERNGYPYTKELRAEGGHVTLALGRWVLDSGGCAVQDARPHTPQVPAYHAERGELALGRTWLQTSFLRVFPLVGLGGLASRLQQEGAEDAPTARSRWVQAFLSVGLGVDLRLSLGRVAVLVGLRLSFQRAFASQTSAQEGFRPPLGVHVRLIGGLHFG